MVVTVRGAEVVLAVFEAVEDTKANDKVVSRESVESPKLVVEGVAVGTKVETNPLEGCE